MTETRRQTKIEFGMRQNQMVREREGKDGQIDIPRQTPTKKDN